MQCLKSVYMNDPLQLQGNMLLQVLGSCSITVFMETAGERSDESKKKKKI